LSDFPRRAAMGTGHGMPSPDKADLAMLGMKDH
jgi:hypothetical protein